MIYVFLADGFEEIEALAPVDILRRAGVEVRTVGVGGTLVTGSHGIAVRCDLGTDGAALSDALSGVVLPGGLPGTRNLEASVAVSACVDFCAARGKLVAAICAAPSILGHKGLLKNKKATCAPGFTAELHGADVTGEPVCRDGNIITARGAGVSVEFGLELVAYLKDRDTAEKLREAMRCRD